MKLNAIVRNAVLFAVGCVPVFACSAPKYIAFAWEFNNSSPQELLKLADEFDKTPLDGVGINLRAVAVVDGIKTPLLAIGCRGCERATHAHHRRNVFRNRFRVVILNVING